MYPLPTDKSQHLAKSVEPSSPSSTLLDLSSIDFELVCGDEAELQDSSA